MRQARAIAGALGVAELPIAEYPGQIATDGIEAFRSKLQHEVTDAIVKGVATPVQVAALPDEPAARDIIFSGTWDEVDEFFYRSGWTEGLPIVPPTIERIEGFLRLTDRSPEERLGVLLPENREAT